MSGRRFSKEPPWLSPFRTIAGEVGCKKVDAIGVSPKGFRRLPAIREDARPVDVNNVIAWIDRTISPGTAFHTNIANDSAEQALANVREAYGWPFQPDQF
jgi:hypothetical protein